MKKKLVLTAIGFVVLGNYFFFIHNKHSTALPRQQKNSTVRVSGLKEYTIPKTVKTYGTVVSPKSAHIVAQDSGIINTVAFHSGDQVRKGQLLFIFSTSDTDNQLQKLKAAMVQARSVFNRYTAIHKSAKDSISEAEWLKSKLNYQQTKASYEAELNISNITAPADGVISDTSIASGDYVTAGSKLALLTCNKPLQIIYQLPEQYVHQVHIGQKLSFTYDNQTYVATVSYIASSLDVNNFTLTLRADIPNNVELLPGAFVQVAQILDSQFKTLAIPQALVQTDAKGFYFYSVRKKKVIKHYFSPGEVNREGLITVTSGAKPGVLVVISNPSSLSVGETVTVVVNSKTKKLTS